MCINSYTRFTHQGKSGIAAWVYFATKEVVITYVTCNTHTYCIHAHLPPYECLWSSLEMPICLRGHYYFFTRCEEVTEKKKTGAEEKKSYFSDCTSIMKRYPPSSRPIIYRLSLWPAEAWRWCVMCFCFTSRLWKSAFYGQALWYVFRAIREEIYWLIIAGQVQRGERRMYKCNTRAQTQHRARLSPSCQAWRLLKVFSSSWSHLCIGFNAQVAGSVLDLLIKTSGQKRLGSGLKLPHKNVTFRHGGSWKLDRNCEKCTTQNVVLNKKKTVQETFHYKSDPKIQFHLDRKECLG